MPSGHFKSRSDCGIIKHRVRRRCHYAQRSRPETQTDIGSTGLLRAIKENGIVTKDSGVHASRRFLSMMDSASLDSNTLNINEEMFKNENITSGDRNIEHFIINRGYKYALYLADDTVDVEISLKKNKQYMASLVNFLLIDSDINKKLGNRPVYEKIEMIESVIASKAIETIIPSEESRKHYYVIKRYLHDESKYPASKLQTMSKKTEKKPSCGNTMTLILLMSYKRWPGILVI